MIKMGFCMGQNAHYFNNANQHYSFFLFQSYLLCCCSTNALNLIFLNSIQNSHVQEPSKLVENLQHLHITTEKNLTSNHCLKLIKSLGFSVRNTLS